MIEDELEDEVSSESEHPVKSKAIYQALETKQDKLVAGTGITIQGDTIGSSTPKMVTLTQEQYQRLVDQGLVETNTYYFTYEGEEPSGDTWHFGDRFPIVLTDHNWEFGDPFPITLTDTWEFGETFPITLS